MCATVTVSDYELVQRYVAGDHEAFAAIVRRYQQPMWWVARRYALNEHDTYDILQEAFFRASRRLDRFRYDCSLKTWLYRLVANAGCDHKKRRDNSLVQLTEDGVMPEIGHEPGRLWNLSLTIAAALTCLRPEKRTALVLVDLLGHSLDEAAEITGDPIGTMKSRRARARADLKQLIAA